MSEPQTVDAKKISQRVAARAEADEVSEIIRSLLVPFDDDARGEFWRRIIWHFEELEPDPEILPESEGPMTLAQARAFGRQLMPFGKHQGEPIDSVDLQYLIWLSEQRDEFKDQLRRYIKSDRVAAEQNDNDDD